VSTREHDAKFTYLSGGGVGNPFIKVRLFGYSLTKTTFHWFSIMLPNSIKIVERK
jgi:hypothetical protein